MEARRMPGHMIRRLHQKSVQVFTAATSSAGLDITPVQFAALDAIHANPGVDQARIAALIAYDRATIGGVIDRLERKGWIVRKVSKRDRRAREIGLSEAGEAAFRQILPVVRALQPDILGGLTDAERDQLARLMEKAIAQADVAAV